MGIGGDDALAHGRQACADRAWAQAGEALTLADAHEPLGPEDLELLATAGYMLGRLEAPVHLATDVVGSPALATLAP
ncbi:MAG TPA: hypothetical protein VGJ70_03125 [Solirubrobacteraceae bacterium]